MIGPYHAGQTLPARPLGQFSDEICSLIMKVPYTMSGKCGNTVWQRNRYGQICYPLFIPFNPRTPAQVAVRLVFATVSARWRTLPKEQQIRWIAVARTKKSRLRLTCGPLTGFNYFVKVNVALANRGLPQVALPPEHWQSPPLVGRARRARRVDLLREHWQCPQQPVSSLGYTGRFDQLPVGPTLFLQANQLIERWDGAPRKSAARVPLPA
jgi:hypothetical protein